MRPVNKSVSFFRTAMWFSEMLITNNVVNDSTQQNGGHAFVDRNVKVQTLMNGH